MKKKSFLDKIVDLGKKQINILPEKKAPKKIEAKEEVDEKELTKEEKIVKKLKINVTDSIKETDRKAVDKKQRTVMLFFLDRVKEVAKPCNTRDGHNKVVDVIHERIKDLNFNIENDEKYKQRYNEGKPDYMRNNIFIPAGYYSIKENTVHMRVEPYLREGFGKGELPKIALSTLIHETVHGVSTNQKDKVGLMTVEKNSKGDEKIIGRGLNEAATVDITEKIIGKTRVNGYSEDYKEVLNTVRTIADIKDKEYLTDYFINNKWYTRELEERFNPSPNNKGDLKKIIVSYDNRNVAEKFNKNTVVKSLYEGFSNNYILKKEELKEKYKKDFKEDMSDIVDYFETPNIDLETDKYINKAQKELDEREQAIEPIVELNENTKEKTISKDEDLVR